MRSAALLAASAATVALIVALTLAGAAHGLALLAYVLFLAAAALVIVIERLRTVLPQTRFKRSTPMREPEDPVRQLERIKHALAAAEWSETYVYESLRPLVQEIVAAGLARGHGFDLERSPERVRAIVGDGYAWDLVRPDRRPPSNARARGWSHEQIDRLLGELESL
jgi:hypothetical protein